MFSIPYCLKKLQLILEGNSRKISDLPIGFKRAAVLIPFVYRNNEWFLVFIRRTDRVSHHKNEISFPGGKFDDEDKNIIETALREANEELGVNKIVVLGLIDDLPTISKYIVTPVVGYIEDYKEIKEENIDSPEIEYILQVPLSELASTDIFSIKDIKFGGSVFKVPFFDFRGEIIWGATGRILVNLFLILNLLGPKCRFEMIAKDSWEKGNDQIVDINPKGDPDIFK